MISLFEKTATTFEGNGICVLDPTTCVVAEVAGGGYTLQMEYPMDEAGKYLMLTEERIIKAPVPPVRVPEITVPNVTVWKTTETVYMYSALPTYRRIPCAEDIKRVKQSPGQYAWSQFVTYTANSLVTYQGNIYRANSFNYQVVPTSSTGIWKYETTVAGSGDSYETQGGTVIKPALSAGEMLTKIADYNSTYMRVKSTTTGKVGYIAIASCSQEQTETSGMIIAAQDIKEQAFRIYKVSGEDDNHCITIQAKHISYDFQGNALYKCEVNNLDPMTAISRLTGALLDGDDRLIISNISGKTVTEDWSFFNPINALLDPDDGLVPALGAQLVRNNHDFYILSNDSPRKGITIAYGINMTGVSWSRNIENVITRVVPRCGDGNDGWLYIDSIYIESDHSTDYQIQRTEMLDCDCDVGSTYEDTDGVEHTYTEATAKEQMEKEAQDRFDVDNCDAAEVELDVQFVLLGDTAEYAQYKGLQTVCLYDEITVLMNRSGLMATAQVTEYEYDCINRRYNSIKISDIKTLARRIPGYRLKKGSITYDKLGNSIVSKIKGSVNISGGES